MSKIEMIKGYATPEVFCAKLTEVAEDVENIACIVQYKDGSSHVFSTTMSNGDIAWLRWVFMEEFKPDGDLIELDG